MCSIDVGKWLSVTVHGLIYSVKGGLLKELNNHWDNLDCIDELYHIR